jgi:uncharacterized protein YifE (UPF0438 family)
MNEKRHFSRFCMNTHLKGAQYYSVQIKLFYYRNKKKRLSTLYGYTMQYDASKKLTGERP